MFKNYSMSETALNAFKCVNDLVQKEGDTHTKRFVWKSNKLEIRATSNDLLEFPIHCAQRRTHVRFFWDRECIAKLVAQVNLGTSSFCILRPINDALWPPGSVLLPIPFWCAFRRLWQNKIPHVSHETEEKINDDISNAQEHEKSKDNDDSNTETVQKEK